MTKTIIFQFYPLCSLLRTFLACVLCFSYSSLLCGQSEDKDSVFSEILGTEPVVIKAQNGSRSLLKNVLVLEGRVIFQSSDWKITGQKMEIYGPLEDPDTILIKGNPATLVSKEGAKKKFLSASGKKIQLNLLKNEIHLLTEAVIKTKVQTLSGESLTYSYDTGKIVSKRSKGRVRFSSE